MKTVSKHVFTASIAASLVLAGSGCAPKKGTSTVTSSFAVTASNKAQTVAQNKKLMDLLLPKAVALVPSSPMDSKGVSISLSKLWLVVKEVEFAASEVAGAGEVDGSDVKFKGPYFIDMLNNSPVALDTSSVPASGLRRIKMKLEKAGGSAIPASAPAALSSNSIYIQGTLGSGGSARSFIYQSDDGTEYTVAGPNAVTPTDGGQVLLEVNFSDIFRSIDMTNVTNGSTISSANRVASTCPNIDSSALDVYTCIRKGLEKYGNVGEDSDKSGSLDAGEAKAK